MAATGAKFLTLAHVESLLLSRHALDRLHEHTGVGLSEEEAYEAFYDGRQLRDTDLILLGYRPAYGRRMNQGQKSWYFRIDVDGQEAIAVIGEGMAPGEYVWLTTYGRNRQTDAFRLADFDMLGWAA